jgi:hypothetical protein
MKLSKCSLLWYLISVIAFVSFTGCNTASRVKQQDAVPISTMILLCSVGTLQNKSPHSKPVRTPFEVWCGGDDSLTQWVCDAADKALTASPDFFMPDETTPGTLVVTITENVEWKEIGKRTKVFYKVEFTSVDEKKLGAIKGTCWDDNYAVCGAQILKSATTMARKLDTKH